MEMIEFDLFQGGADPANTVSNRFAFQNSEAAEFGGIGDMRTATDLL